MEDDIAAELKPIQNEVIKFDVNTRHNLKTTESSKAINKFYLFFQVEQVQDLVADSNVIIKTVKIEVVK